MSERLGKADLFKNAVGCRAFYNTLRHDELLAGDRAMPKAVASFCIPYTFATRVEQKAFNVAIEGFAHSLGGQHGVSKMDKAQIEAAFGGHLVGGRQFGSNQPDPLHQRLVGGRFGGEAKAVAYGHEITVLGVIGDFNVENDFFVHSGNIGQPLQVDNRGIIYSAAILPARLRFFISLYMTESISA